ncbi:hypothetical protein M6B38_303160 [Iris pallida]|uniref:Uncharacterized protein n=1 Tax=Iris pallida TaxID=29817 RepID=A0AAX6HNY4_IRIPA|nr:hypothetical protein M6B38_383300 [Iris pallida]KAJ6842351.1 hypothetical protein M6B38_303160 [Iris pallida]
MSYPQVVYFLRVIRSLNIADHMSTRFLKPLYIVHISGHSATVIFVAIIFSSCHFLISMSLDICHFYVSVTVSCRVVLAPFLIGLL